MPKFYALIVAAGRGERAGGDVPKQYALVRGKSLLRHSVEAFLACPSLQELRVVIQPEHRGLYEAAISGLDLPPPVRGGEITRQQSVYNGLQAFGDLEDTDKILIHDAARPFVHPEDIEAVVQALNHHTAAVLAVPVTDTLRSASGRTIDRADLWSVQTPQGFLYGMIRRAHEAAALSGDFTDDAGVAEAFGMFVHIVEGRRSNIKITTQEDFAIIRQIRTGMGFDVHAFGGFGPLRLCGVDIPYDKGLIGHSDADVALHALTDALLGTMGAGDIGTHFPPSDPKWKNAHSSLFVFHALKLLTARGGTLIHVDMTIIAQAPPIAPHRQALRHSVATTLTGLSLDAVSVKATTTEGLGFIGRGEGIAVQTIVSVLL